MVKISVIIITRNREKMLKGCLESLVKQTRMPDEVIVVDNLSTDNTKKVVLSFNKKLPIKYFVEKQIGIPYARNKGIKTAKGSLILMLDDDCEADKFWVENMIKAHKKYPKAWAIQGRTFSLPQGKIYSLLAEFNRFIFLRNYAAKQTLGIKDFFSKESQQEIELLTCDTNNLSINASYLRKYKLSFDDRFYLGGEDIDLGRQIIQKNGSIMFSPSAKVNHYERPTLAQVLNQRWYVGRNVAKIADKWKTISLRSKMQQGPRKFLSFLLFCKASKQLINLPILLTLFFLDNLYYLNGYLFEKRILSLEEP